jgi:hypothetical protein
MGLTKMEISELFLIVIDLIQVEFRPEISKEAADAGILTWLMKRLKVKVAFDSNKLYASEILSILLQVPI